MILNIIIFTVFAGIIGFAYMFFEARNLKVERVEQNNNSNALKIIQLSDIHINFIQVSNKRIRKIIKKENPDIILLTGDYIQTSKDVPKFEKFLDEVIFDYKVLLVLGNHDYEAFCYSPEELNKFVNMMKKKGIQVLENKSIVYKKNNLDYNIIGISDIRYKKDNLEQAYSKIENNAKLNIVISHNPDLALKLVDYKVDYFLCGHFHGGQIKMPFKIEFFLLRKEKLCKMGLISGLVNYKGIKIYINRGIGNVCFPLRFLSRPEITIMKL